MFTFSALAAETQGSFKDVAIVASSVADRTLAAQAALVHGVGHQRAAPTELSTQLALVDVCELDVTEPERLLAVGWRAIASARARQRA
ncbi:MAG TPA: hypothetical protein VKQ30_02690 [Ktedonobacterales bacterium]|nr:hypothetical protein [Ktedonobacterales bacterium]